MRCERSSVSPLTSHISRRVRAYAAWALAPARDPRGNRPPGSAAPPPGLAASRPNGNGQIAYMTLLPRDRLGVVVVVNTWSVPLIHGAVVNRIMDTYLGYPPRDWAGETLARVPAARAAQDSQASTIAAMKTDTPPPLPLRAYAGRYEEPLYGLVLVRSEPAGLTLQMGEGEMADLEYHGTAGFYVRWHDPFVREYWGTHVTFETAGDSVLRLRTRIGRDEFTALKSREKRSRSFASLFAP